RRSAAGAHRSPGPGRQDFRRPARRRARILARGNDPSRARGNDRGARWRPPGGLSFVEELMRGAAARRPRATRPLRSFRLVEIVELVLDALAQVAEAFFHVALDLIELAFGFQVAIVRDHAADFLDLAAEPVDLPFDVFLVHGAPRGGFLYQVPVRSSLHRHSRCGSEGANAGISRPAYRW